MDEEQESCAWQANVLDASCPSRRALELITDKWTVLIIHALTAGTKRTGELQRAIAGVTPKMLTQTLRAMEYNGLVQRRVHPVVPPMVEYSLTALGESLVPVLGAVCSWAEQYLVEIEQARAQHADQRIV